jgi:alcohol dehydrogenase
MVVETPGKMAMWEFALPEIGEEDGLLRVELAGVCGSDPGMFKGKSTALAVKYPLILGHEIVGRIEKLGARAAARRKLKEGDRVIVETAFGCGHCRPCLAGNYVHCEAQMFYGHTVPCSEPPHLWGAYGRHLYIAPRAMVHKIDESLPPEEAVFICAVLGNAIRWLRMLGGVSIGQTAVIEGPGLQGLAGVIVARESGADKIIVTGLGKDGRRFALAKEFGATHCLNVEREDPVEAVREITGGEMADVVMEVTGHPEGPKTALDLARKRGTIVLPGIYGAGKEIPLVLDKIVFKELKIQGVLSQDMAAVLPAIRLAESRKYPLAKMITHRFPLEEAEKAVRLAAGEMPEEEAIKVVIVPF